MYRSPVKGWQVSWFVFGTITLNDTDTTVRRLDINVKTFSVNSSAIFANNGVCAIQSDCPQNKPADLPLFYWRPVHSAREEREGTHLKGTATSSVAGVFISAIISEFESKHRNPG